MDSDGARAAAAETVVAEHLRSPEGVAATAATTAASATADAAVVKAAATTQAEALTAMAGARSTGSGSTRRP